MTMVMIMKRINFDDDDDDDDYNDDDNDDSTHSLTHLILIHSI